MSTLGGRRWKGLSRVQKDSSEDVRCVSSAILLVHEGEQCDSGMNEDEVNECRGRREVELKCMLIVQPLSE